MPVDEGEVGDTKHEYDVRQYNEQLHKEQVPLVIRFPGFKYLLQRLLAAILTRACHVLVAPEHACLALM